MAEELIEEGIILESSNGIAEVALIENDHCEECSAKIFCNPRADNIKTLKVADPYGTKAGDEVKISIKGKAIVKATFALYGAPLLLLVITIFTSYAFFEQFELKELYSFLVGVFLLVVYYLLYFFVMPVKNQSFHPKIIFVKRKA
ncbi:MAG: SoxR reducing system RseC family protein [Ignavibacteria bacterium]|jgi:sigma-E factor negative regulatory protein RseC